MTDGNHSENVRRDLVDFFSECEQAFDLVDIEWNGFQIWPIVRARLSLIVLSGSDRRTSIADHAARLAKPVTRFVRDRLMSIPPLPQLPSDPFDVLVFGDQFRTEALGPILNQDRVTGPIGKALEAKGIQVCYLPRGSGQTWTQQTGQWRPSKTGPPMPAQMRPVFQKVERQFHRRIHWHSICSQIERIYSQSLGIEKALTKQSPKLVILPCWYATESLPITLACRRLGIPVVEVQHGLIDATHPCYGGFSQIPARPYAAMCNAVWFWGRQPKAEIESSSPGLMNNVQTYVGGYPYLQWNLDRAQSNATKSRQARILVAMQTEGFFDQLVAETIQVSPVEWKWLVKFHPRSSDATYESFRRFATTEVIERTNHGREFLEGKNIYQLFAEVDCVLTGWSTVALEARAFGIPVILLHENGRTAFNDFVESGDMRVATTSEAIIEQIQNLLVVNSDCSESRLAKEYFASEDSFEESIDELVQLL